MKTIQLALFILIVSTRLLALGNEERVLDFSITEEIGCATTTSNAVRCWRNKTSPSDLIFSNPELLAPPQNLKNPNEIVMDIFTACVTTDEGIRCWGKDSTDIESKTTSWKTPRKIAIFNQMSAVDRKLHVGVCAVTDNGVLCTDNREQELGNQLTSPDELYPKLIGGMCVLQDNRVLCSEPLGKNWVQNAPKFLKKISVAAFHSTGACAVSKSYGLTCWGSGFNPSVEHYGYDVPKGIRLDAVDLDLTTDEVCLVTAKHKLRCWGAAFHAVNYTPARVSQVIKVKLSGTNKCVLNPEHKLTCWSVYGERPDLDFPIPSEISF